MTSRLGTGKYITFFYSILQSTCSWVSEHRGYFIGFFTTYSLETVIDMETGERLVMCSTITGGIILNKVHALGEGRNVFVGGHIFE